MEPESGLTVDLWHDIVLNRRLNILGNYLAEDVLFRSPFVWRPYTGRYPVFVILSTVSEVFRDISYLRQLVSGEVWALKFSANVGELSIRGIDLIELNREGLIQEFEVFIRPANGLLALGDEMRLRLAEKGFV